MDIGFSCTVWAGGERAGHLDGIGIYSQALWQGLREIDQNSGHAVEALCVWQKPA